MKLPTDEQLEERVRELTDMRFPKFINAYGQENPHTLTKVNLRNGFYEATLSALKIDRESYRLLMRARHEDRCFTHMITCLPHDKSDDPKYCICGLDAHLTTLRTRLGITE